MSRDVTDITETTLQSESVYEGSFLKVRRDTVRLPNGREGIREYVRHPGAVVVIAFLDDERVIPMKCSISSWPAASRPEPGSSTTTSSCMLT